MTPWRWGLGFYKHGNAGCIPDARVPCYPQDEDEALARAIAASLEDAPGGGGGGAGPASAPAPPAGTDRG